MAPTYRSTAALSDADLDFLVTTAAPEVRDKLRLRQLIKEDRDLRNAFIADEKTSRRVVTDKEAFLKISPSLYFEILLRKARQDLERAGHTIERAGTKKIAVFDTQEVVGLISKDFVLSYLSNMLASFTKVESYSVTFPSGKGIWHKLRFNDMDIDSLIRFCEYVDEGQRLDFFKRIADICLFALGVFPEYIEFSYRYPHTGQLRRPMFGRQARNAENYVEEGKKFYKLAAEHPAVKDIELSEVFETIHGNFLAARKPLNFIAEHYLHHEKHSLFGSGTV
jgi:hypothetical protein